MEEPNKNHFVLIKKSGFDVNQSFKSAKDSTNLLLDAELWPLYKNTRCQHMVKAADRVLFYLAGEEPEGRHIVASAIIKSVEDWSMMHRSGYPLLLEDIPSKVLMLTDIERFMSPIDVKQHLDKLSFIPANRQKWGVAFMGGMRAISEKDHAILSGQ